VLLTELMQPAMGWLQSATHVPGFRGPEDKHNTHQLRGYDPSCTQAAAGAAAGQHQQQHGQVVFRQQAMLMSPLVTSARLRSYKHTAHMYYN
jgi:hypothetical protein